MSGVRPKLNGSLLGAVVLGAMATSHADDGGAPDHADEAGALAPMADAGALARAEDAGASAPAEDAGPAAARPGEISDCLARMHVTDLQAQCALNPSGAIGAVSCQSVQSMIESARLSCTQEVQARKEQAEQERKRREQREADDLVEKIEKYATPDAYEDLSEEGLRAAPEQVEEMRERLHDLRPDYASSALPGAQAVAGFVAGERKCRASSRCMSARASRKAEEKFFSDTLLPICVYSREMQLARESLARYRKNQWGEADAGKLRDDRLTIEDDRQRIRELMPAYTARRHRPFAGWRTEARCVEAEKSGRLRFE